MTEFDFLTRCHTFMMAAVTSFHEKAHGCVISDRIRMKFSSNIN